MRQLNARRRELSKLAIKDVDSFHCDVCDDSFKLHGHQQQYYHYTKSIQHRQNLAKLIKAAEIPREISAEAEGSGENTDGAGASKKDGTTVHQFGEKIQFARCTLCLRRLLKEDKNMIRHYLVHKTGEKQYDLENSSPKDFFHDTEADTSWYFFEGNMEPTGDVIAIRQVLPECDATQGNFMAWCKICDTNLVDHSELYAHLKSSLHQKRRSTINAALSSNLYKGITFEDSGNKLITENTRTCGSLDEHVNTPDNSSKSDKSD